jgi:hypothetical protein
MIFGAVTVGTDAILIVAANSSRRNLSIVNNGLSDIFIGPDNTITTSTGLTLFGGSTRDQDIVPEGYKGAVWGIAGSDQNVRFWETDNA